MKIAIIGSGALGLYYGGLLQRSGQDVHFLMRRDFDAVRKTGLKVFSINGDFHLPEVSAYQSPTDIGPVDLVLVGLKTFSNAQLPELIMPLVGKDTAILTLQNGLGNEELLADAFGGKHILGGIAFLCSNRGEPGTVHHLGEGRIRLGEFQGGLSERSRNLAEMFKSAGTPCEAVSDLRRARWEKLLWNIPFNGLCALLRQDVTQLLSLSQNRDLVRELMLEVAGGANAQALEKPLDGDSLSTQLIAMTEKMDHYRPSMMIDRLEDRPLELEAIYGIPLRQAIAAGIDMTRVRMLYSLLLSGEE